MSKSIEAQLESIEEMHRIVVELAAEHKLELRLNLIAHKYGIEIRYHEVCLYSNIGEELLLRQNSDGSLTPLKEYLIQQLKSIGVL